MTKIHARFRLDEDTRIKHHSRSKEHGEWEIVEAAHVKLGAVQGEPFGNATPSGTLDMVIVNPEALRMFRGAKLGQEFDFLISPVETK